MQPTVCRGDMLILSPDPRVTKLSKLCVIQTGCCEFAAFCFDGRSHLRSQRGKAVAADLFREHVKASVPNGCYRRQRS